MKRFWRHLSNWSFKAAMLVVVAYFLSMVWAPMSWSIAIFAIMTTLAIVAAVAESKADKHDRI